jgi:hypothetical protein
MTSKGIKHRLSCRIQIPGRRGSQYRAGRISENHSSPIPRPASISRQSDGEINQISFQCEDPFLSEDIGPSQWSLRTQLASDNWDSLREELYGFLLEKNDPRVPCACSNKYTVSLQCISLRDFFLLYTRKAKQYTNLRQTTSRNSVASISVLFMYTCQSKSYTEWLFSFAI